MGQYLYKVTAKKKTLSDGTEANIAVFAYKPHPMFGEDGKKLNRRLAWKSGCHIAERYVQTSNNFTGRVVLGETGEIAVPMNRGTFLDGWFGVQIEKILDNS